MKIRLGYDISYHLPHPTPMVLMLNIHASRMGDLLEPDEIKTEPLLPLHYYYDGFGNRCARLMAPKGKLRLTCTTLIEDSGKPEVQPVDAPQIPVQELPDETMVYLQGSRYCETDRMSNLAWSLFGKTKEGWPRVLAILEFVQNHLKFDYLKTRATKSAIDAYNEKTGVCRDFQHLAITFCRCMNVPARYCTGYLGDIGVPAEDTPMDFSAWFEVFLGGRWHAVDARHVKPRIGRILMGRGRDAADVPLSSSFGFHTLAGFKVVTEEVIERRPVEPIRAMS
ncbi:transglutaminase-like domain-containing protein [Zavarzinia aquatilis]|uniref:Transglutaminase n=1 Tax=Zavarzinia aquatilis TaxID=2211142 RepID=A0A317EHE9_9PROT|nr:transglutaminase family protein [Zavarzinia aquatilis]PWR26032.1 transglutaminase [Zavarzinia aquatilis]